MTYSLGDPLVVVTSDAHVSPPLTSLRGYCPKKLWSRPNLTLRQRELVTSSVLIVLGRNAELRGHLGIALRVGLTPQEVSEAIVHLGCYAGFPALVEAIRLFAEVLDEQGRVTGSDYHLVDEGERHV